MLSIDQIRATIKKACKQIDVNSLEVDVAFRDQGLDSLDMFNIFLELEAVTGSSIPDAHIELLQSINSIQEYFGQGS
jgi:acyl carrier protein